MQRLREAAPGCSRSELQEVRGLSGATGALWARGRAVSVQQLSFLCLSLPFAVFLQCCLPVFSAFRSLTRLLRSQEEPVVRGVRRLASWRGKGAPRKGYVPDVPSEAGASHARSPPQHAASSTHPPAPVSFRPPIRPVCCPRHFGCFSAETASALPRSMTMTVAAALPSDAPVTAPGCCC